MEAYTSFAQVYDLFQDNIPYGEWADYLKSLLNEYGVKDGLVLDLGCGTGTMTEPGPGNRQCRKTSCIVQMIMTGSRRYAM